MAQGPSDTIFVAIRIMLRIRESKVRNPDPPDRRRFVLSEHSFLFETCFCQVTYNQISKKNISYFILLVGTGVAVLTCPFSQSQLTDDR